MTSASSASGEKSVFVARCVTLCTGPMKSVSPAVYGQINLGKWAGQNLTNKQHGKYKHGLAELTQGFS